MGAKSIKEGTASCRGPARSGGVMYIPPRWVEQLHAKQCRLRWMGGRQRGERVGVWRGRRWGVKGSRTGAIMSPAAFWSFASCPISWVAPGSMMHCPRSAIRTYEPSGDYRKQIHVQTAILKTQELASILINLTRFSILSHYNKG